MIHYLLGRSMEGPAATVLSLLGGPHLTHEPAGGVIIGPSHARAGL